MRLKIIYWTIRIFWIENAIFHPEFHEPDQESQILVIFPEKVPEKLRTLEKLQNSIEISELQCYY